MLLLLFLVESDMLLDRTTSKNASKRELCVQLSLFSAVSKAKRARGGHNASLLKRLLAED